MRQEKKGIVEELVKEIGNSNPIVITDYKGIKAHDLGKLRTQLIKTSARYKIVQNRLFNLALEQVGKRKTIPDNFKGPLAVAYGGSDALEVVKVLVKFAKDNPDSIKIKGGIVDNEYLKLADMEHLAKLRSKEVLLSRLVGQLNAPISRFVMVLNGTLQKFVSVIGQISDKKQKNSN